MIMSGTHQMSVPDAALAGREWKVSLPYCDVFHMSACRTLLRGTGWEGLCQWEETEGGDKVIRQGRK